MMDLSQKLEEIFDMILLILRPQWEQRTPNSIQEHILYSTAPL